MKIIKIPVAKTNLYESNLAIPSIGNIDAKTPDKFGTTPYAINIKQSLKIYFYIKKYMYIYITISFCQIGHCSYYKQVRQLTWSEIFL